MATKVCEPHGQWDSGNDNGVSWVLEKSSYSLHAGRIHIPSLQSSGDSGHWPRQAVIGRGGVEVQRLSSQHKLVQWNLGIRDTQGTMKNGPEF